jgi:hypothetical protein
MTKLEARLLEKHGIRRHTGGSKPDPIPGETSATKSPAREPAPKAASEIKAAPTVANKVVSDPRNNGAAKRAGAK